MADRRPSSFRHHNTDISLYPLSTNRRFQPFTQLAGLGTMVVAGMTPESIQVLIPDCTERPVGDNVTVDLRHVVELFMGNSLDMGTELPATNLAEAMCPNSLAPTLILGQWEYWDEINPLLTKWRNVNKTRCPICARLIVFNMSRHLRLVHTTYCCYWSRQFSDHKKTTGQLLWMDLALARLSGQELRNTYTITSSPEIAPLRKFFRGATHQLDCLYTGKPDSLHPQGRMLSLFDQICTDLDSHTSAVTSSAASTPDNKSPTVSDTTVAELRTDEVTTPTM